MSDQAVEVIEAAAAKMDADAQEMYHERAGMRLYSDSAREAGPHDYELLACANAIMDVWEQYPDERHR